MSAAMYERFGSRIMYLCIAVGCVIGTLTGVVATAVAARYLKLTVGQAVTVFALMMPLCLFFGLLGLRLSRDQLRAVRAWSSGGAPGVSAVDSWYAVVNLGRAVTRCAVPASIALPVGVVYIVAVYDKPWYAGLALLFGSIFALVGTWVIVVSASELIMRPMLEDVASHLPPDFEPDARGMTLRTKALAPLPIVTMMAAFIVGAYADLSRNLGLRLLFATGVALGVTAIATIIFVLLNRAALAPIDELIIATRRVRAGDISTPVPLVTADELGTLAVSFNEMLADLRRYTEELRASRERIVAAADEERRRVERDLHDGAQQQLVLLRLKLGAARQAIESDPAAALAMHDELGADLDRALAELRDLAHGLYPASLQTDGLPGALREAADSAAIPATVSANGTRRYRPDLEAAVYFCCLEALQNASKHAGEGARAQLRLGEQAGVLRFEVADDGRGFDPFAAAGSAGLQNMTDRIGALGGSLKIESQPGKGTAIKGEVPV